MDSALLVDLMVWYLVFLFSTSLHEASHAFFAYIGGDYTAYQSGQVTLNPVPHMKREPVGMIVIPLLSFFMVGGSWMIGWASAPFNPFWAARYPRRALLMSLAGPLSHLIPIIICITVMIIGLNTGFFSIPPPGSLTLTHIVWSDSSLGLAVGKVASVMLALNLVLLIFNLLPFPPMDGSEIIYQFIKSEEERLRWRGTLSRFSLIGLLLAWRVFPIIFFQIANWVFQFIFHYGRMF